jgi:ankyrin repeat protein/uncharacterized glyoxalase superfamily protein PhnB
MSSQLPERPSLEYLKKLAKDRLQAMRRADPRARLAAALLAVANDHGFSSWRALKSEVERRQVTHAAAFGEACSRGDLAFVRAALANDPALARGDVHGAHHQRWTPLHAAARAGHVEVVRLLLEHGADPHVRESGDNTYPLHWAAAHGHLETVRLLLDAGSDVHGIGDLHELDVIGWATFFRAPGDDVTRTDASRAEVIALLIERGARHHVFSAMSIGDPALVQQVVEQDPSALDRRMSRFERGQSPVHFAIDRKRYDLLDLVIELGADVEALDGGGRTPLAVAMLSGDEEAMRRLRAAGAAIPVVPAAADVPQAMAALARSVKKGVPMIYVPDVALALDWYAAIGFTEQSRYEDSGVVNFGFMSFGGAEIMFNVHGKPGAHGVSLWFYTDQIDSLYQALKSRQLDAARAALEGQTSPVNGIVFQQDIEDMFYGARQFAVRDLNGYLLYFISWQERTS